MIQAMVLYECQLELDSIRRVPLNEKHAIAVLIRGTVRAPDSDDLKRRPETYGVILHARPLEGRWRALHRHHACR